MSALPRYRCFLAAALMGALLAGCATAPVGNSVTPAAGSRSTALRAIQVQEDSQDPAVAQYMASLAFELQREWRAGYRAFVGDKRLDAASTLEVAFSVDATGKLRDAKVVRSSGSTMADNAALLALRKAAPYSAFPAALRHSADVLHIRHVWYVKNSHPWQAEAWRPSAEQLLAAERMVRAQRVEQRVNEAVMEAMRERLSKSPQHAELATKFMNHLNLSALIAALPVIYASYLAPAEADAVAHFMQQPTGQKALDALGNPAIRLTRSELNSLRAFMASPTGRAWAKYEPAIHGEIKLASQGMITEALVGVIKEEGARGQTEKSNI